MATADFGSDGGGNGVKIFASDDHLGHAGFAELRGVDWVGMADDPRRVAIILAALAARGLTEVSTPVRHGPQAVLRVHDAGFVRFLEQGHAMWAARPGAAGPAVARMFGMRGLAQVPNATSIDAMLSAYTFDVFSPLVAGSWQAIRSAADLALTGAAAVHGGAAAAFSLCRPPGHHASQDLAGGYCYLNNAAIAAQSHLDGGAARVAVLDVDYHHGNGTQRIFYDRGDVLFVSLHGRPEEEYPFLLGFADEVGVGPGEGCNVNLPMPKGTTMQGYGEALAAAMRRIRDYGPDVLVVSLGVDAHKDDPVGGFLLETSDFLAVGQAIARIQRPVHFVMEGGYALEALGANVANVLTGYLDG